MNTRQYFFHLVALVIAIAGTTLSATAATNYWVDAGTNWNTGVNWSTGNTNTSLDVATFTNNTAYAFQPRFTNTTGNISLGAIWQSGSSSVTITGSGGGISLSGVSMLGTNYGIRMDSGAGALTIFPTLVLATDQVWSNASASLLTVANANSNSRRLTVAGSGNFRINGGSGAGTLTMNGTGTLTLLSSAGFTSGLIVNSGTVAFNNTGGTGLNAAGAYIGGAGSAATLVFDATQTYFSYNPNNTKVIVDNQGMFTFLKATLTMVASGQSLIITNGGSFVVASNQTFYVFGVNNGLGVVGGSDGRALVNFNGGSLNLGMTSNGGNVGSNNWLRIDGQGLGAVVTNIGFFAVAGNHQSNQRTYNNSVIITNGGQLFTGYGVGSSIASNSYIGYNSNNTGVTNWGNRVTIAGNNGTLNSTWNNNGRTLFVGYSDSATGVSTGNWLEVGTGGVVTNTRLQVGFGSGILNSNQVILNGGSIFATTLTVTNANYTTTASGNRITFNSGTLSVATSVVYSNGTAFVVGDGTGSATLILPNSGTHRFQAGLTIANNGTLIAGGTIPGTVTVQAGGTLSPGNGVGLLIVPNLTLESTANLAIELGVSYDQVRVTGTAPTIGGANLVLSWATAPTVGNTFLIIDNQTGDTISGEFAGWADLSTQTVSGVSFQINYGAGDGNDVLLTTVPVVVPEPSSLMLVAVALGCGLMIWPKRRRS